MRIAAIDIGTNTTLLAVADVQGHALVPVCERAEITRLGRGLSKTGVIGAEGLAETRAALKRYRHECAALGVEKLRAVATAAMRSAKNAVEVRASFKADGVDVEIIDGDEEAALTFLSAQRDFANDGRALVVIDVGGGSTEVIFGDGHGISWRKSFPVGAVRAKELWMPSDPPTPEERDRALHEIDVIFADLPAAEGALVVAVAGTPTTLAAMHKGIDVASYSRNAVHGTVLSGSLITELMARLSRMKLDERHNVRGLEPKRADVIDTGSLILLRVMARLGADAITVSDGGVRWGVLWRMFEEM